MMRRCAFSRSVWIAGALCVPPALAQETGQQFVRGDPDADGDRTITDAIYLLGCFFLGSECPSCADSADVNDDGSNDITDPVALLSFLFTGGPEPPAPAAACGAD